MSAELLRIRDLVVAFDAFHAIDGLDLTLREQEVRFVIGPNGAGKTTLLNAITGFQHPTAGTVEVNGVDAKGRTPLHSSASDGSENGAMVLCAHGADVTRRDRQGHTPYDLAVVRPPPDAAHMAEEFPGLRAGWLRPGGGCEQLATKARSGQVATIEEVAEIWRRYYCAHEPAPSQCAAAQ